MAPVTCRRRPDGLVEIVPPSALQRFVSDFRSALVAMGLLGLLTVVAAAYALVGSPVLLVVACAAIALALWQRGKRRDRAAAAGAQRAPRRSAL
jgi:hypothetical protein